MIRVLHIVPSLDGGGIEHLLLNYYKHLNNRIEFDFAVSDENDGILAPYFVDLGANIYHIPKIRNGLLCYISRLTEIISQGHYDVVHVHAGYRSFFALIAAKVCSVKIRIAHAHTSKVPEKLINRIVRYIFSMATKLVATDLFACGVQAAEWTWGKNNVKSKSIFVMKNAIDAKQYAFKQEKRRNIRNMLDIPDDAFVIGNIGRMSQAKNHRFIVDTFEEIYKLNERAVLVLVGHGELFDDVKKYVSHKGLDQVVIFTGVREDVNDIYCAFDVLFMPSLFEGLPVTLVEAQANGLSCFVSTNVTQEVLFNANIHYMNLNLGSTIWANEIVKCDSQRIDVDLDNFDYEITNATESVLKKYTLLVESEK